MFKIGNIEIQNPVVLAPMAGISDPAYMKILESMHAGYFVTELISAEAIVRNNKKTLEMLNGIDSIQTPVAVQLFGANADTMAKAARVVTDLYPNVFIDINMGCPVPKVAIRAGAGSALLKDPSKIKEIVSDVVRAVSVPVTVKIRSGWDQKHINAVEVARAISEAGASAIAIHARTRSQGYQGTVDLDIIKQVKESVSIPVIGNGDIKTVFDARHMMEYTGCDAVMIGRGALGNPWLIRDTVNYLSTGSLPKEVTYSEKIDMVEKHLRYLLELKEEKQAILEMRTHISHYLKGMPGSSAVRAKIMTLTSQEEVECCLEEYRKEVLHDGCTFI